MSYHFNFQLLIVLCSTLYIQSADPVVCTTIYQKQKEEKSLIDGLCKVEEVDKETGITTISLQKCENKYYCNIHGNKIEQCQYKFTRKFEGDSCAYGEQCFSGICTDSKCVAIPDNDNCNQVDGACKKTSYCDNTKNICMPLSADGESCQRDEECSIGFGCHKEHCVRLFSLTKEPVDKRYFCKSGQITNDGFCKTTAQKYKEEKGNCTTDDDCEIIEESILTTSTNHTKCTCNKMGKKYCGLTSNTTEWENYINVWNQRIDKMRADKTLHPAYLRIGNHDLYQPFSDGEIIAAYKKWDAEYKEVDQYIIDVLNGKFYSYSFSMMVLLIVAII